MSLPTTISDLVQTGRVDAPDPRQARTSISRNLDFTSAANVQLDFSVTNQQQVFGIPRTLYIDNGTNPNPVYVTVSITNQQITIAPLQVGYFPLNAADKSVINFQTDGGATAVTPISVYNYELPASNWYSNGTGSTVASNAVQGSMNEGADVSLETNNDPIYIGGIDRGTGLFHGIAVDATGKLQTDAVVTFPTVQTVQDNGLSFNNIKSATTTVVKNGAGVLSRIVINTPIASNTIAVYDNTAGSGTLIGTLTIPSTVTGEAPMAVEFGCAFATGLTLVTSGTSDLTVIYR